MGNDVHLLDKWYRKDSNKTPPESILLPITTHLVHFLNKRQPKLQARDAGIWWGTLGKLQLMLRKAAKVNVNHVFTSILIFCRPCIRMTNLQRNKCTTIEWQ